MGPIRKFHPYSCLVGVDKEYHTIVEVRLTFGHLSRLVFSLASLTARSCSGAFTNACVRVDKVCCAAFRSAAVGVKYSSDKGTVAGCYPLVI